MHRIMENRILVVTGAECWCHALDLNGPSHAKWSNGTFLLEDKNCHRISDITVWLCNGHTDAGVPVSR